jgi:DNA modification methylase
MEISKKLKKVKLSDLKPYKNNAKIHTDKQIELVKKSIQRNEYIQPIAVDKNNVIIIGHCRYQALLSMENQPDTVEVVDCSHLKPAQVKKLRILDNKANESKWDDKLLQIEVSSIFNNISLDMVDVDEIGLSKAEIEKYMPNKKTDGDDDIPENVKTITKLGDLWELGRHRVLCSDSTKEDDVNKLMDDNKIDMVFTDPPYGVSYADKNEFLNNHDKGNRIQTKIKNDHMNLDDYKELWLNAFKCFIPFLSDYSSYYICSPQGGDLFMMMMIKESGLQLKHQIIWAKNNHVLGRSDYNYKHEPIFYGWFKKHKFYGNGEQKFSVWNYDKPHKSDLHPTMKPVELISNAILNSTQSGNNIVYDGFLGSGSTLIACEKTNRICYGMELDPHYCDVIVQRYIDFCTKNDIAFDIKLNGKKYEYGKLTGNSKDAT